jgi:hypothetical protein
MMQLLFTQLLRKTSVVDRVKVKGQGRMVGAWRPSPFCSTCFLTFFSAPTFFPRARDRRGENSETQSSQEKGPGSGSTHPYQLQTGRWMNFRVIDHEPTPYSDAHVCAPSNPPSKHVFYVERSQCIDFYQLCPPT